MIASLVVAAVPAQAVSPNIVISQVYGGGGNTGAPFTNDYVELFNRGSAPVDLTGWSVQYSSATGTGNFAANSPAALSGTLLPGQYHLVALGAGAGTGVPLPTADTTGTINLSGTAGKVVVANTATGLACNGGSAPCTPDQLASIVDLVGYGGANFFEGAAAPALSNTTAGLRATGGCVDTDNNATDVVTGAPTPRNTATTLAPCGPVGDSAPSVVSTAPADGATDAAADASITITFSEPVSVGLPAPTVVCSVTGGLTYTAVTTAATYEIQPSVVAGPGEVCTVTVLGAGVTDTDTDDPPDTMSADYAFSYTVAEPPAPAVPINEIQGASHTSPSAGDEITTLPSIVTAEAARGFYLQGKPAEDDDDVATSEAIFVFTSSAPTVDVGDEVTVSGTVTEFRPGGATSNNLTITEIDSPTVTLVSSGNPLPATTVIGAGGRTPPTTVIDDDSFATFDPDSDGIDFYESLEAMRVQVNDPIATGPTNNFGEVSVVGDGGAYAQQRTARGGVVVTPGDFNPERIFLDDTIVGPTPRVNTGDGFSGPAVGVMDYSFGNYKVYLTSVLTGVDNGLVREATAETPAGEVSIATFNVENLNPNDPPSKFAGLAEVIVDNLKSPDIVGLEEIQDNDGPAAGPVVDADLTLELLVAAIESAGGPTYEWRQINPVAGQDGGQPGGNIRVGFLYRTDRGVEFVDRPGGDSTTPVSVVAGPDGPELSASPGRVDPTNPAWASSRKPLAAEFLLNGETFFVVVNHFNSKGGDDALFGQRQPPIRSTEVQRAQQAASLNAFVDSILAVDPAANVVALGDFNDFEFSDALQILLGGDDPVLNALVDTLPPEEQYTYVFEGNSQTLDHILVSDGAESRRTAFDVVHVNSEFVVQTSDHDPSVARFSVNDPPTVDAGGPYTVAEGGLVTLTAVAADPDGDAVTVTWDLDGDGTFETAGESVTFSAAALDGPATVTVAVQASDGVETTEDTAEIAITNVAPTATLVAPPTAFAALPFTLSLTGPSDPSEADTAAGFTYAFDCGSGYGTTTSTATESCTVDRLGPSNVGARITDKDGGVTEYRATVQVFVTFDSLCSLTRAYSNDPLVASALCGVLDAAEGASTTFGKQVLLAAYRVVVGFESGTRPWHAFTSAEGATLQRLSRAL